MTIARLDEYLAVNEGELAVVLREPVEGIRLRACGETQPRPFYLVGRLNGSGLERLNDIFWNFKGIFSQCSGEIAIAQRTTTTELHEPNLCDTEPAGNFTYPISTYRRGGLVFVERSNSQIAKPHCISFLAGEGKIKQAMKPSARISRRLLEFLAEDYGV